MSTSDVLRKAADVIRERGWNQGHFETLGGRVCVLGAINVACGLDADSMKLPLSYLDAEAALRAVLPVPWPSEWNDERDRTAEEVIAALLKAAEQVSA